MRSPRNGPGIRGIPRDDPRISRHAPMIYTLGYRLPSPFPSPLPPSPPPIDTKLMWGAGTRRPNHGRRRTMGGRKETVRGTGGKPSRRVDPPPWCTRATSVPCNGNTQGGYSHRAGTSPVRKTPRPRQQRPFQAREPEARHPDPTGEQPHNPSGHESTAVGVAINASEPSRIDSFGPVAQRDTRANKARSPGKVHQ